MNRNTTDAVENQETDGGVGDGSRCLQCDGLLPNQRSRRYCSDKCRVAAWRRKHQLPKAAPVLPAKGPSRSEATIYECPQCETRYVGVQYCIDCSSFCRKVGLGGTCPNCDEPVTYEELDIT